MTEQFEEQQKIEIRLKLDADQFYHLFCGLSEYANYRYIDPETDPLVPSHPVIMLQGMMASMVEILIVEGMKAGNYIGPLLEIKRLIAEAEEGDGTIQI